jgi:peptide/nickel transport system substrate-binding protein
MKGRWNKGLSLAVVLLFLASVTLGVGAQATPSPADMTVGFLPGYEKKAPEDGGTFTRSLPADPVTLNPVVANDMVSFLVYKWIFDPLVDMDQDARPVGVLAERWENSADNRTTTFHLRKGVKWHDGKPFTADDVLFTYEACMDPAVDAINKRSGFEKVAKVEKVDDLTVKVSWKEPFSPGLLSFNIHIMPRHIYGYPKGKGGDFNKNPRNADPVGTGPFKLVEWKRGERVVLKANPDYFAGRPHLEQLILKTIPQGQTQLAAYQTGQLDMTGISAEQWKTLKNDQGFLKGAYVFEYYSRQMVYIGWNQDGSNPFFGDKRVRQAMSLAMNRQGVVDKILDGHGKTCSGFFYPGGWDSNPDVKPVPYDPAKAAALLDAAGWKDTKGTGLREKDGKPFSFECLVPAEVEQFQRFVEVFQQDLKRVGVQMAIRKVEWSVFLDRTHRHQFQAYLSGWSLPDDPDPYGFLHSSQAKLLPSGMGEGQNDVSYSNPEVDKAIEAEQRTFNQAERQQNLRRIHQLVAEDQPHTYCFMGSQMVAVRNRFQNVRVSRAGYGLFTWYPSLTQWWVPKELQK